MGIRQSDRAGLLTFSSGLHSYAHRLRHPIHAYTYVSYICPYMHIFNKWIEINKANDSQSPLNAKRYMRGKAICLRTKNQWLA